MFRQKTKDHLLILEILYWILKFQFQLFAGFLKIRLLSRSWAITPDKVDREHNLNIFTMLQKMSKMVFGAFFFLL